MGELATPHRKLALYGLVKAVDVSCLFNHHYNQGLNPQWQDQHNDINKYKQLEFGTQNREAAPNQLGFPVSDKIHGYSALR